jgi:hypothetical protein
MRRAILIAAVGLGGLLLVGCGGSGGGSTTSAAQLRTSKQAFKCLFLAGYKPVPDKTHFGTMDLSGGRLPGYVDGLAMKLPGSKYPVIVSFYSSDAAAEKAHSEEATIATGASGTASNGNVVLWHAAKVPGSDLKKIEACAFR